MSAPRVRSDRLPSGIPGLDAWLDGWPSPGVTELGGRPGSGRLGLLYPLLSRLHRQGRVVGVVDPWRQLHPPALPFGGTELLLVRPPATQAAWTAEQMARSGALDAVILLDLPRLGRAGLRLSRAADLGGSAVFVLGEEPEEDLPATLRLTVEGHSGAHLEVRCRRHRGGRGEGETRRILLGERPEEGMPGEGAPREEGEPARVPGSPPPEKSATLLPFRPRSAPGAHGG